MVVSAATAPTKAVLGQNITTTWTVTNQGELATPSYYWYDRIYLSDDERVDSTDTYLTTTWSGYYNSYQPLAAGGSYQVALNLNIPGTKIGNRYLLFVTDAYNYQSETSETNNVKAVPILLQASDLVVTNATAPRKSLPNARIGVSWTVKNQGDVAAAADWYDSVYLSTDSQYDPNTDINLKDAWTGSLTPLAVNDSYTVNQFLSLPSVANGSYYLLFAADRNNYQFEGNESNNVYALPIQLGESQPDLVITTAASPSTATLGDAVEVSWTVKNQGNFEAPADWYDTIYISDDTTLDSTDTIVTSLGMADKTPLASGASYTIAKSITIPNTKTGSRYLLFVADAGAIQNESDEGNNILAVPINLQAPDLIVSDAFAPLSATWGETSEVSWTVKNQGSVAAAASWWDQVYLSDDNILDGTDKFISSLATGNKTLLALGGSYTQNLNIIIPGNSGTGRKYLLFVADANDYQGETNNTNNVRAVEINLKAPNLQVTAVTAPAVTTWSENLAVSWTVTNQGNGAALSNWYDYVYLSANPTLDDSDINLGSLSAAALSPLAAGSSYTLSRNIDIPSVTPGSWYLLFATDNNGNQQSETNEADNVRAIALEVKAPDLVVSDATAPAVGILGQDIAVTWTVKNQGTGVALTDWYDEVYLSTDSTLDGSDLALGYLWTSERTPLAADGSYTVGRNVTVPNVAPGSWYLLFATDRGNYQPETDNTNNVRAIQIALGAPDIQLTTATAPATASVGETVGVSWTVTNTGNITAPTDWYDGVYLSSDASFDSTDIQLGYSSSAANTPLKAGDSYTQNLNITIPQGVTGDRYLLFFTDPGNNQGESNETNNTKAVSIKLGVPDLTVTEVTAPNSAIVGNIVPISWTVTNSSDTYAALNDWYDSVYLSNDATLDSLDRALSSWWTGDKTPLAPGASYTLTKNLTLPNVSAGDRYLLFVADGNKNQAETNDTNNVKSVAISLLAPPDLVVSNVIAPTLTIGDPATATVSWDVTNVGLSSGNVDAWSDRIVASKDSILGNGDDIVLGNFTHTGQLAANASYSRSETLRLPPAFVGRYQLFVQTDATGQVFENGKEANNADSASNYFDVVHKPYADLAISAISSNQTATSGQPLNVSWTVVNSGIGTTDISSWYDNIQLALDPEGKNIVANLGSFERVGTLAVGGSYNRSVDVTLPNGLSGTYYLVLTTGGPFEFIYDGNNTKTSSAVQVTLAPPVDLVVTNITAPTAVQAGDKIDVSWTVANSGTGSATGGWIDKIYLQQVGSNSNQLIELGSFAYGNLLAPGKVYTRSEQLTLPSTIQGQYQIVVKTNATNSLYEVASSNNTTVDSDLMLVSLLPRPDLQVKEIAAPTKISAGGTIALDYAVINQGTVATNTPNWQDKVYLSLDNTISADDILLGDLTNSAALGAGESYRNKTQAFVVPKRLRGSMFLIVETDANKQVNEFPSEANNTLAVALNVESLPPADLVTSNVVAPTQAFEGSQIEVRYSVANLGIGETDRDSWTDTIWLTRDKNRPSPITKDTPPKPDDILLATFTHNGSLAVGERYDRAVNVTLPELITGEWYITAWSDAYNLVLEDSFDINANPDDPNELDSNNYKSRPITVLLTPPPDLVVTSIVPTAQAKGGEEFDVSWTVTNSGASATKDSEWFDTIYLSDSPTLNTPGATYWDLDTVKHNGTLAANSSYTGTLNTVLSPSAAGKYVIVKTNSRSSAWEGNYTDDNSRSVAVDVTATPADLIVTNVKTIAQNFSGERTTVEWTVQNVGETMWAGTRYWYDEVWISPDATFIPSRATKVGFFTHSSQQPLGKGDSYTQRQEIVLPAGFDGNYYVYVSTDYSYVDTHPYTNYRGTIYQSGGDNDSYRKTFEYRGFEDPSNNLGSASIGITYREADLKVTNLTALPSPPKSGETIAVTWSVTNIGTRNTREDTWYDRVYLSRDSSLDESDLMLGQVRHTNGLEIGSSYTQTTNVTLPDGIEGNFHLLVFTDSNIAGSSGNKNVDFESYPISRTAARVPEFQDEGNNITAVSMPVILNDAADLQVTSIIAPERSLVGQPINLQQFLNE